VCNRCTMLVSATTTGHHEVDICRQTNKTMSTHRPAGENGPLRRHILASAKGFTQTTQRAGEAQGVGIEPSRCAHQCAPRVEKGVEKHQGVLRNTRGY